MSPRRTGTSRQTSGLRCLSQGSISSSAAISFQWPVPTQESGSQEADGSSAAQKSPCGRVQWMWGDVGINRAINRCVVGKFCPWRWSIIQDAESAILELQSTKAKFKARPVVLWEDDDAAQYYPNVAAAVARLQECSTGCQDGLNSRGMTKVMCGGWYGVGVASEGEFNSASMSSVDPNASSGDITRIVAATQQAQEDALLAARQTAEDAKTKLAKQAEVDALRQRMDSRGWPLVAEGGRKEEAVADSAAGVTSESKVVDDLQKTVSEETAPQADASIVKADVAAPVKKKRTLQAWPSDASTEAPSVAGAPETDDIQDP